MKSSIVKKLREELKESNRMVKLLEKCNKEQYYVIKNIQILLDDFHEKQTEE